MTFRFAIRIVVGTLLAGLFTHCGDAPPFSGSSAATDVFHQLYNNQKIDFLWVVDNSASMIDKRNFVKDNLQTFLTTLNTRKAIDFQMAMTTTDMFSFSGALVQSPSGLQVV